MSLQEKIFLNIQEIGDPKLLQQILSYVESVKNERNSKSEGNKDAVLAHAGFLSDDEADEMRKLIDEECGKIDGDW